MNGMLLIIDIISPIKGNNLYLDPGSGSLILQLILAAGLGGLFLLRSYWKKIRDGVVTLFIKKRADGEDEVDEPK